MECREKIDIINDLKNLHQDASASAYVLNRIIVKAHKAEGYNGSPKDYSCNSSEEAKSFFISLATESSLTADQTDIVLASWALFDGYPDDESITFTQMVDGKPVDSKIPKDIIIEIYKVVGNYRRQ